MFTTYRTYRTHEEMAYLDTAGPMALEIIKAVADGDNKRGAALCHAFAAQLLGARRRKPKLTLVKD